MPTLVVQNDHIIRALQVMLDPDCPKERLDAFADYYSVDMPEFPEWCETIRAKYPAVAPAHVILADDQQGFLDALPRADAVVVEEIEVREAHLETAPKLKIVQNFRTDMRNIDVDACARRGIPVLPFQRNVNIAVGEHAFALMMALGKRLAETNKLLTVEALTEKGFPARVYDRRHTANSNWARITGIKNMRGSTLGIVGLGSVGREVARWAAAFGMRILYHQRNRLSADLEAEFKATYVPLNELFARSDFISLHVPLGPNSRGLIGEEQFAHIKPGAILVDIARADLIDQDALVAAIQAGKLGGLGMDVHYQEPGDPHPVLRDFERAILSPHIAIGTRVNGAEDMERLVANLAAALG